MSAPDLPRFRVDSLTGYAITESQRGQALRESTLWYVFDSWCSYKTVDRFSGLGAEARARRYADRLERRNAKEMAPARGPRGVVTHGTNSGYVNIGCRCDPCKDAHAEYQRAYRRGVRVYKKTGAT